MGRWIFGFIVGFLLAASAGFWALRHTAREEGAAFPPPWIATRLPERFRSTEAPPSSGPSGPKSFGLKRVGAAPLPFSLLDAGESDDPADDVALAGPGAFAEPVARISAHSGPEDAPRMPRLEVRASSLPEGSRIRARLEVLYRRPYVGTQPDDRVRIPRDGGFRDVGPGETWRIWEEYAALPFFGGDAALVYQLTASGDAPSSPLERIPFRIAGENPDDDLCQAYLLSYATDFARRLNDSGELAAFGLTELPAMWFAHAIARSESSCYNGSERFNQFWSRTGHQSPCNSGVQYAFREGDPLVVRTKGEQSAGGNGMFQVTGNARDHTVVIPREQLWDWRENVHAAFAIFKVKQIGAHRAMAKRRQDAASAGQPLPPLQVGAVTFADESPHTMEDAVTIKRYNGMSKKPGASGPAVSGFYTGPPLVGDFCYWHDSRRSWALAQQNNWGFNYVARVCSEIRVPSGDPAAPVP